MTKKMIVMFGMLAMICVSCSQKQNSNEDVLAQSNDRESNANTFTTENIGETEHIHNTGQIWGDSPSIRLVFLQQLGSGYNDDRNSTFYKPTDVALDREGNLYVLDSGNFLIKKFSPEGNYLASYGGEGQGPGEFQFMEGIAIDDSGKLFIADKGTNTVKILSADGEEIDVLHPGGRPEKIGLLQSGDMVFTKNNQESEALILVVNKVGELIKEYGQEEFYEDFDSYRFFNKVYFTLDKWDNIFVAYATRNKIEKYSPSDGKILSIDRPLNYNISQEVKYEDKQFGPRNIKIPFVNYVSAGIAIDDEDRIWVLSFNRQLKYEEMGLSIAFRDGEGQFEGTQALKTSDETETDAYAFHVFNRNGLFLGEIPLSHHGGIVRIHKNFLYILEPRHTMSVYIYQIEPMIHK